MYFAIFFIIDYIIYSILFCSVLFCSILFYSILFYSMCVYSLFFLAESTYIQKVSRNPATLTVLCSTSYVRAWLSQSAL